MIRPHILLDMIILTIFGEASVQVMRLSLCSLLQPPATFSDRNQHIPLATLFSSPLKLCSFLNVRDQDLEPYKTTSKIIVLYILIKLERCQEDKILNLMAASSLSTILNCYCRY